jgi:D-amino-acid dehydrogenase
MSAMETSFANGGQLSASNAEVWNSIGTIFKGMKWMLSSDAPLLVNPMPSWHKYSWMAEFVSQIPNYKAHTVETVRLAIAARELLLSHAEKYNIDCNFEHRGILHFYSTEKEYKHAEKVNELYAEGGLERHAISPAEISKIEPALDGSKYHGGFFTPSDFTGDIHRYTAGLAQAIEKEGVTFRCGVDAGRVKELKHCKSGGVDVVLGDPSTTFEGQTFYAGKKQSTEWETHHFDNVVVCAGVRSRDLAAQLNDRVNIYPVKGYSITVNMNEDDEISRNGAPWVSLLDDEAKIVTSRLGPGRFRIAGTAEFNGYNRDIRHDRIQPLVNWCNTHFPTVSTEDVTPWSGLRPMMPSMLPRIGAGFHPGVFYNTGHGHLGWTLSAATAEMVAESVLQQQEEGHRGRTFTFSSNIHPLERLRAAAA